MTLRMLASSFATLTLFRTNAMHIYAKNWEKTEEDEEKNLMNI
jgi:hypothetical protein